MYFKITGRNSNSYAELPTIPVQIQAITKDVSKIDSITYVVSDKNDISVTISCSQPGGVFYLFNLQRPSSAYHINDIIKYT